MDPKENLDQEIRELLESQKLAVLATQGQGQPYTSLVAFASSPDLQEIYFATSRSTRKYENVTANPKVSLLVDNRSNDVSDFHLAKAATALGEVREADDPERQHIARLFLTKHPHLDDFVQSPTSALLRVRVKTYYLVSSFQKVRVLHMDLNQHI